MGIPISKWAETTYKQEAAHILDEALEKHPYAKAVRLMEEGIVQDTINGIAQELKVDLIIMGIHGRTGLNHFFMGSVAEHVIRHASVPVMVIPAPNNN